MKAATEGYLRVFGVLILAVLTGWGFVWVIFWIYLISVTAANIWLFFNPRPTRESKIKALEDLLDATDRKERRGGFIQFGVAIVILVAILLIGGASYSSHRSQFNEQKENRQETVVSTNADFGGDGSTQQSILCNGTYYTQCADDLKFVCPKTGEAYCEAPLKNNPASVAADTLLCNGKEWLKCQQGHNFYCPAQGDAQCIPQPSVSADTQVIPTSQPPAQQSLQNTTNLQADVARKQKSEDVLSQISSYLNNLNSQITQVFIQAQQKEDEIKSIKKQAIPQQFIDAQVAQVIPEYNALVDSYDALVDTKEKLQTITYEVQDYRDYGTSVPASSRSFLASIGIYW